MNIEDKLYPLTKEEHSIYTILCKQTEYSVRLSRRLINSDSNLGKVFMTRKSDKEEFGYIVSSNSAGALYTIMKRLSINNLIDIGCGMGFILNSIAMAFDYDDFHIKGIDNEPLLLDIAKGINYSYNSNQIYEFIEKDMCDLASKDILNNSIIYWYAPLISHILITKFVNNLYNIIKPGQILAIIGYDKELEKVGFKYICNFQGLSIFIK